VAEAQQRVREYLMQVEGASGAAPAATTASAADRRQLPGHATGAPPQIIWSDAAYLAQRERPDNPVPPRPRLEPVRPVRADPASAETVTQPPVAKAAADTAPADKPPADNVAALDTLSRQKLLSLLADRVQQGDDPAMSKALTMAMLSLADPTRRLDPQLLEGLTPSQGRLVHQYHQLVVALGLELANGGGDIDVDAVTGRLDAMFGRPLEIKAFKLCRRVDAFGLYDEVERDHTLDEKPYLTYAGKANGIGLYIELDHFKSTLEDEFYVVRLSQELTLYTHDGVNAWSVPATEGVDRSRNRRRDFFTTQVIQLPAELPPGKYLLKVRVTDRASNTLAEATAPIHHIVRRPLVRQTPPGPRVEKP